MIESLKGLNVFLSVLKGLVGIKDKIDENQEKLIRTLGMAARETEVAINKLKNGENTVPDLENTIASKWVEASALLKKEDKQLALTLYAKGQAWTNVKEWTDEDFDTAISNIRMVDQYVKEILSA
ncbi:hypothetical protein AAON49_13595 [Pseudotenacibaculum sp. MALMAid0570]|uniref:hypothetical protein n=1 Tax=Pseudotenacibaculum sp. MALMAid0570 TaxID=3143938 RepID=UPI0032DFF8F3